MSLWHGEAYVLQIDSHMRFVSGWDEILIQQLGACGQDKAVLSTYPPGYALPDNVGGVLCKRNNLLPVSVWFWVCLDMLQQVPPLSETPVPVMCFTKFGEEGLPRFTGEFPVIVSFPQPGVMQQEALAGKAVKATTGAPIPGLFWAAGFSFSRASLFTQVPYDSSLKHLFFGE
jgi:[Skp1-protein]-hydroxyproline N-acetylglucosaminyltransferase